MINKYLKSLNIALKKYCNEDVSEELESLWDEPWHEEAVREFGGKPISEKEEEEQLKETVYYYDLPKKIQHNVDYSIMLDSGIQPVTTDNKTMLGSGSEGRVYNAIYNG